MYVLRYFWELPQNIIGLALFLIFRKRLSVERAHGRCFLKTSNFAVSLGNYIFWSDSDATLISVRPDNKAHEYGHSIQSLVFGPLYLIVIGIPSLSRNLFGMLFYLLAKRRWDGYYNGYPEKWADNLGRRLP
jgi:hypothetical protein